ncbi:MAG: MFS transporter [Chloroflexota bacterium]|nr:MAG: MFS transporter [Chloroflexota bacterium]
MNFTQRKNLQFNFIVNVLDGGFFGAALGFASFITIIPLFVSKLTDSAVLIGLIPAIHAVGWQLPQLFTAPRVSRLSKYKKMAVLMSLNERLPFLGLALVAWFSPQLGVQWSLVLTFLLLIWQGFGGGFTATAWQSLIAKIIPLKLYGRFFGIQSSAVTFLMAIGAIFAGLVLAGYYYPLDYTICFLLASIAMAISLTFLALTKEEEVPPIANPSNEEISFIENLRRILKSDRDFRWYLLSRMLTQFATMGFAFYTIYAVREFSVDEKLIGFLTGLLLFTEVAFNPLLGWLGDRRGHLLTLQLGIVATVVSLILAMVARGVSWFFPIFILAGIANVAAWTVPLSMTLEFSSEAQRPAYIGLANTLVAPSTFIAPILAGFLIDNASYQIAFLASAISGIATLIVLLIAVKDPRRRSASQSLISSMD